MDIESIDVRSISVEGMMQCLAEILSVAVSVMKALVIQVIEEEFLNA